LLGHELAHCVYNHGEKALAKQSWRIGVDDAFAELDEVIGAEKTDIEIELESFAAEVLKNSQRRWSLNDELQADSCSTVWLVRSGYDCEGLLRFLKRIYSESFDRMTGKGDIDSAWIYSRDELSKRIQALEKLTKKYRKSDRNFAERFNSNTR